MSSDSKRRKIEIVSPSNTSQVGRIRNNTDIDWDLCFLCHTYTGMSSTYTA